MEPKLLMLHSIMLLYWESRLETKFSSADMIKTVMDKMKLPEVTLDTDDSRQVLVGLRSTVFHYCNNPSDGPIDKESLIQRIRLNISGNPELTEIILGGLSESDDQTFIKRKCLTYSECLNAYVEEHSFKDTIKKITSDILYKNNESNFDPRMLSMSIQQALEPYSHKRDSAGVMGIPGVVGFVDCNDDDGVRGLLEQSLEETSTDGILKSPWKEINDMTGHHQGFRRGDQVVVGALQHNYKTGFTLKLVKGFCLYNTPYMLDNTKKPIHIHISAENHLNENLTSMAQDIYETEHNAEFSVGTNGIEDSQALIKSETSRNGYTLHMLRVNPSDFNHQCLVQLVMDYEADGWEIHSVTIDYLNMLSKVGCEHGAYGVEVRDIFRRTRNFMSARKILSLTPHQISKEATYLKRQGVNCFVKEIANKSYWDSCKTIDQEVDLEILLDITKVTKNGETRSYLEVARGKHRKLGVTPEKYLYCCLPFSQFGGVRDNLYGEYYGLTKPGSDMESGTSEDWMMG